MPRRHYDDDDDYQDGIGLDNDDDDYVEGPTRKHSQKKQQKSYSWEDEYKRSWETLQEDEDGSLSTAIENVLATKRRRLFRDTSAIQRGIIRHLYIIIDASIAMIEKDLRPSRMELTLQYIKELIIEYFDQNPISQLGIILMKDGLAEKLTELNGNPLENIKKLNERRTGDLSGEPSLQNALEMARASLRHVPSHGSREILITFGSLSTSDPGNINDTILNLIKDKIRVNMVGLAAEVQICRSLTKRTNGSYGIVLNEDHFRDLLFEIIAPPAVQSKTSSDLIRMGFPKRLIPNLSDLSLCVCHSQLKSGGYICPQCNAKICDIPRDCDICGLTLVSSPHLARSFHHLFPVPNFKEEQYEKEKEKEKCFSCLMDCNKSTYKCPICRNYFCLDCDVFIHDVLHTCPGCLAK